MTRFTVYVDSREQLPYKFNRYPVDTEERRLETGDYCVAGDGIELGDDGFNPNYAVERKTAQDFLKSITWERDRFEDELARADNFSSRMPIVVEKPWPYFEEERYYKNVSPNAVEGTVEWHPEMFYVEYFFERDRRRGEQLTYEFLRNRNRKLQRRPSRSEDQSARANKSS